MLVCGATECAANFNGVNKVLTTRANWTPSEHSMLCSRHFTDDCFEPKIALAASFGITKRKKLKPTAVPSLFEKQPPTDQAHDRKRKTDTCDKPSGKKSRRAYEKREISMVSMFLYTEHAF